MSACARLRHAQAHEARRAKAAAAHPIRHHGECAAAWQHSKRTTIKQPVQPVRTGAVRLVFSPDARQTCRRIKARRRAAYGGVTFKFFCQHLCKIPRHSSKQTAWSSIAAQPARGQLALGHRRMLLLRAQCGRAKERALLACFLVACLGVHMLVVHMPLCRPARCVRQLQASQPASMCIQSDSQLHLGSPPRTFSSVQFSSVIGYRLSVIGDWLSVISPHAVVRMPFDLDPVFLNT